MITTLLFDLDDTLLGNDMGVFIPAYLRLFVEQLHLGPDGQRFAAEIMAGTRAMLASADPARTLRSIFTAHFFPAMGWEAAAWEPRIDDFYRRCFPELQPLTTPRPEARPVMEWAFGAGYQVAIATNPLFPLSAIRERIRWAGLGDFPFALVTSYETSHFAKPHPEYFAEILANVGARPDEALVIGNDWRADLVPAAALGLPHYWIAPTGSASPTFDSARPVGVGGLDDFLGWARGALPDLGAPPHPPAAALPALLAGHLAAAVGALADLPDPQWKQRPAEGEWSLTEIVCHWRDVESEVHWPRLQAVTGSDNPFLIGVDSDPWAAERDYQSQSGPGALQDFIAARKQSYSFLASRPASVWSRPARHSMLGPTHLAEIVGWILDHDRIHLEQLRTTRKKALS